MLQRVANALKWTQHIGCPQLPVAGKSDADFSELPKKKGWKAQAASPRLTTTLCYSKSSWQQQLWKEIICTRSSQPPGSQGMQYSRLCVIMAEGLPILKRLSFRWIVRDKRSLQCCCDHVAPFTSSLVSFGAHEIIEIFQCDVSQDWPVTVMLVVWFR